MDTITDIISRHLRNITRSIIGRPVGSLYKNWNDHLFNQNYNKNDVKISSEPPFEIDLVYTWVDHTDPEWQKKKNAELARRLTNSDSNSLSFSNNRFYNRDELKYSLRSIDQYANFINNIFIVTAGHSPAWLDKSHPRIHIIPHSSIMPGDTLPTFNANAIECSLHNIPGLAEHFIYMNDDVFIGQPLDYRAFFNDAGQSINYLSDQYVNSLPAKLHETGLVWGIKNSRKLIADTYGKEYSHKILHSPHSFIKSTLLELEALFTEVFINTKHSRFREIHNIGVTYALYQSFADICGTGVLIPFDSKKRISCYINLASPFLELKLHSLACKRNYLSFCLNEPIDPALDTSVFDTIIKDFLQSYFAEKCQFEK